MKENGKVSHNVKTASAKLMRFEFLGWKMGLEPTTLGITIRCSNQLSYIHHKEKKLETGTPDRNRTRNRSLRRRVLYPVELRARTNLACKLFCFQVWSGRWDSNSRPSAPKADALTGLRYAPTCLKDLNYRESPKLGQAHCCIFL